MARQDRRDSILLTDNLAADMGIVRIALRDHCLDHILDVATNGQSATAFVEKADRDSKAPGLDLLPPRHARAALKQRTAAIDAPICSNANCPNHLMRAPEISRRRKSTPYCSISANSGTSPNSYKSARIIRDILVG